MDADIIQEKFFSAGNIQALARALLKAPGTGVECAAKSQKGAAHYASEVWEHNGPEPILTLNNHAYSASLQSFRQLVQKQAAPLTGQQQIMQRQMERRAVGQRPSIGQQTNQRVREAPTPAFQSVQERYTALQEERMPPKEKRPPIPDFKISTESDKEGPTPAELFDLEMKRREDEAARIQAALEKKKEGGGASGQTTLYKSPNPQSQGIQRREVPQREQPRAVQEPITIGIDGDEFTYMNALMEQGEQGGEGAAPLMREGQAQGQARSLAQTDSRKKTQQEEEELASTMNNMDSIYRAMAAAQANPIPIGVRDPNGNATLAQPSVMTGRTPQQMDTLIRQDPVVSYKETEENLFLYSADRDWVNDDTQSRYNFTINFDPANNKQGFNKNLTVQQRFRNISRIELVKTILPIEGVETFFNVDGSGATGLFTNTSSRVSVYQFPYLTMRIPELDVNNYGTDDNLNNSFAVIQYDADWYSDSFDVYNRYLATSGGLETGVGNNGYTVFIPKHLKCQKVFQPAPLATLQKLTVELQRPDGSPVSPYSDIIDISSVVYGDGAGAGAAGASTFYATNIVDSAGSAYYIILKTKAYFNRWQFTVGDRILLGGLTKEQIAAGASEEAKYELLDFLQDPTGHTIVGVGVANGTVFDGYNSFGYANWIAIRAPINDPTTGATSMRLIGGTSTSYNNLGTALNSTYFTKGRILNYSHQVQVVLRVITRGMDSTSRIRPDNL